MKKDEFDKILGGMIANLVELRRAYQDGSAEEVPAKLEEFNKLRAEFSAIVDKFHSQKSCDTV